ncbi:MAG TPA: bifunctional acetate--CoA ligase family protein/GNAT family N-acetyltransferase [Burkholderiaceae bacterium]|nr:bifunctional acetate--CoA ligase family protein/GNAT family N-acetyltransferase [Burkholderiaceae bacterium]
MLRHRLSPLLDPGSVALYGATEREGAIARRLHERLRDSGFRGRIGAINPKHREVLGEPCVPGAASLDFVPDVALAAVPPAALPAVVRDCAARGTRFVVVFETGAEVATPEGLGAQDDLVREARALGVRLVGPHAVALIRPVSGLDASFVPVRPKPGRVALLSQSGALASALIDWAVPAGIGFSSVLTLGRELDLGFGELLDWYLFDARTDSVLLYLEGVRDARGFMSSVRALSRVKPVVIMKAGHGGEAPGPRAGASHSDALTGNDRVFEAAIARAGAVRAETTMQFLAAAKLLALRKRTAGPRLAVLSNGAGPGVLAADAVAGQPLELATLAPATIAALDRSLPAFGSHANPVDLRGDADGARLEASLRTVLADPGVDVALAIVVPQAGVGSADAAAAIARAATDQPKPVAAVIAGGASAAAGQRALDEAGVPHFLTPENAVDALALLEAFSRNQVKLRQVPVAIDEGFAPDVAAAEAMYRTVVAGGRRLLDEVESKALLGAFGIAAPPSIVARDAAEAGEAASRLGFPVVLKVLSPDIVHKSDVGGVRINVQSAAAARAAAEDILESVGRMRPDARISGVVVQPMIRTRHQREVHLGMATDPMFGAVIAFGAGGVAVEQIDDVAIGLPPLNASLARALVQRTRIHRLLRPYRNVPGIDFGLLEQTIVRFSALVCACPWIASVDINPLVVDEDRAIALDARIEVGRPESMRRVPWRGAYGHLAIHPYPRELEETLTLRNGTTVRLRPIRPEDAERERAFIAALSPQTLYRRFMMPVKELSPQMIERFTQIDYDRELAIIALHDEAGGPPGGPNARIVAVARIIPTWEDGVAEFAIVVGDWLHRSGLGRELMQRMFEAARARGYSIVEGVILGENVSMLRFCERLGFTIRSNPDDPAERIARRKVG